MENRFKLALCQMRIVAEEEENLKTAEAMIREAAAGGARFVCLPEMFNCPYSKEYFKKYLLDHREIYIVGVNFDSEKGNLIGWEEEKTADFS